MTQRQSLRREQVFRNLLISLRLLNVNRSMNYSGSVAKSRWGEAIAFLLAERGWTQRELADKASLRPNTVTNLVKHGRDSDTATLSRIAAALKVDVAELFMTREQIEVLRAHRENRVERLKEAVMKELSATVGRLVQQELDKMNKPEGESNGKRRRSSSRR